MIPHLPHAAHLRLWRDQKAKWDRTNAVPPTPLDAILGSTLPNDGDDFAWVGPRPAPKVPSTTTPSKDAHGGRPKHVPSSRPLHTGQLPYPSGDFTPLEQRFPGFSLATLLRADSSRRMLSQPVEDVAAAMSCFQNAWPHWDVGHAMAYYGHAILQEPTVLARRLW